MQTQNRFQEPHSQESHSQESHSQESHSQESHIEVSTDAARQGVTGHNVRYVLGFGLFGIVLVFALLGTLAAYGWLGSG